MLFSPFHVSFVSIHSRFSSLDVHLFSFHSSHINHSISCHVHFIPFQSFPVVHALSLFMSLLFKLISVSVALAFHSIIVSCSFRVHHFISDTAVAAGVRREVDKVR